MSTDKPTVTIYTDGGCDPNPGPGGWGVVLLFEIDGKAPTTRELKGGDPQTTNNRMELTAAIEALRALNRPCAVELYTDSQYLKNGITEWMPKWKKTNFKKGKIQNVELWEALNVEVARHEIHWHWVKGHAGNLYNERVDQLATSAIPYPRGRTTSTATEAGAVPAIRAYLKTVSEGSPGAGAWAVLFQQPDGERVLSGGLPKTNANRLDLLAAIAALEAVPPGEVVQVWTMNSYLHDGITRWIEGWKQRNWTKKEGGEVLYRDLWQRLDQLTQARRVQWALARPDSRPPELDRLAEPLAQAVEAARRAT
jgi:ribonuclease HI